MSVPVLRASVFLAEAAPGRSLQCQQPLVRRCQQKPRVAAQRRRGWFAALPVMEAG